MFDEMNIHICSRGHSRIFDVMNIQVCECLTQDWMSTNGLA